MSRMIVADDPAHAARATAELLAKLIRERRADGAQVHIALAGGATPRPAYTALAGLLDDWTGIHVWLGDERYVPRDDPESNARLVAETLLAGDPVPPERFHAVPTHLEPGAACAAYARELEAHLEPAVDGTPVLDVALLGIGEDAHTASLFPGAPELAATGTCALVLDAPKPPPVRITLTLPVLRAARHRIVLVAGAGKAHAVARALGSPDPRYPASLLPGRGTTWILDDAAASALDEEPVDG